MATDNVWDNLNDPQVKSGGYSDYFGQIKIDAYPVVLVKGAGKVPFDPGQHSPDKKVNAVDLRLIPLAEMNISWDVTRNLIAESREWAGTVLPSIKALGLTPLEINNKWVHVFRKETGETYTSKKDGKKYPVTTFEFVAAYPDEASCRMAWQAFAAGAGAPPPAAQQPPANGNGNGKEKETAAKFLGPIITNGVRGCSNVDEARAKVAALISQYPMLSNHFTVDSPEVVTLMMGAMS